MDYRYDCRLFTGYKPCRHKRPCPGCPHYDPVAENILIISLEAMGAVLRSTCLLPAIKRRYPGSRITWLTKRISKGLLEQNPFIDRIWTLDDATTALLAAHEFDVVYAVDKSEEAGALAMLSKGAHKHGFGIDRAGKIIPLNEQAGYQYDVGLDDELKFFRNQKTETQMLTETMGLRWDRDPYVLRLSSTEAAQVEAFRRQWGEDGGHFLFGYNTGCSTLYPYKKFTVERSIEMIRALRAAFPAMKVVLLGGPEDTQRHLEMKQAFTSDRHVIDSPTAAGIRTGLCAMAATDLVFSGCSLGLHMAIALQKPTICWFGVSCAQEIDLYDRGVKLLAEVGCSPCWKKACDNEPKCYDMVSPAAVVDAVRELRAKPATFPAAGAD